MEWVVSPHCDGYEVFVLTTDHRSNRSRQDPSSTASRVNIHVGPGDTDAYGVSYRPTLIANAKFFSHRSRPPQSANSPHSPSSATAKDLSNRWGNKDSGKSSTLL